MSMNKAKKRYGLKSPAFSPGSMFNSNEEEVAVVVPHVPQGEAAAGIRISRHYIPGLCVHRDFCRKEHS